MSGSEADVTAVLNPYDVSLLESIELAIRDAVVPWVVVTILGVAALAIRGVRGAREATLSVGSSWAVAGLTFFLVTGEARGLLLTQVGLIILACLTVQRIIEKFGRRDPEDGKKDSSLGVPGVRNTRHIDDVGNRCGRAGCVRGGHRMVQSGRR